MTETKRISRAELETIIQGHKLRNAALRQMLVEKGVDLGETRRIECYFWCWSQANAASLAADLARRGFEIVSQGPARSSGDSELWNIEAAIEQSADLTLRREFTDELVRIASVHFGKYDGWGTQL
jgi:Regulator of ribonuclease activity B